MSLKFMARLPRPARSQRTLLPSVKRWGSSISQRPGSDRVRFPGAVNSKFTTEMSFINPAETSSIPTYRVMNSDGVMLEKDRKSLDVSNEEILTWYKNMLTVSVMDVIMFEAQRQGRLSFYMVRALSRKANNSPTILTRCRFLQEKRASASAPQLP